MPEYKCWCGYDGGGSHYHCPECGAVTGMMGHRKEDCEAYKKKQAERLAKLNDSGRSKRMEAS